MTDASRSRRHVAGWGLAALSAITGVISYNDGLDVVRQVGIAGRVAYLIPLVPDLMIVTSSMTLIEAARSRQRRPFLAMLALAAGIGWTVAMNAAAGWHHGPGGVLLLGAVPVAFVLTFETLTGLVRRGRGGASVSPVPAAPGQPEPAPLLSLDDAIAAAGPHMSKRQIAAAFEISRARVDKVLPPAREPAGASTNGDGPHE